MSQATPPEGNAPGAQPLDPGAPPEADLNASAGEPLHADTGTSEESDRGPSEAGPIEADEDQAVLVDETFAPADMHASSAADVMLDPDAPSENDVQDPASADRSRTSRPTAVVRYGIMRSVGEFRHNSDTPIPRGTKVVIRSERGVELGEVIAPVCAECDRLHLTSDQLRQFLRDNGSEYPFRRDGRILRLANPQDVIDYRHLEQSAKEAAKYCRQIIRDQRLDMRLVSVEHLLGGERLVFFFAAEHRVDFRDLVRLLASQYRTRIEMRQVGARDEARLVADYERCGQQCCCQSFLKDLRPVSMRMAKTQKATLDPSKISGRCGRLMCCLRYEDATYEQLRKQLPHKNTYVRTAAGVIGRVVDTQIITQLVRVQLADFTFQAVATEDIVERNLDAPPKSEAPAPPPPRRPEKPIYRKRERLGAAVEAEVEARREQAMGDPNQENLASVGADAEDDAEDSIEIETAAPDKADQTRQPADAAAHGGNQPAPAGEGTGKKRRRRRRKKGPQERAAQAAGVPRSANNARDRGDEGSDGDGGEGSAPGESNAGHAGQASQAGQAGQADPGGDRKSRHRRRRSPRGQGNQNRPAGAPPPPAPQA